MVVNAPISREWSVADDKELECVRSWISPGHLHAANLSVIVFFIASSVMCSLQI